MTAYMRVGGVSTNCARRLYYYYWSTVKLRQSFAKCRAYLLPKRANVTTMLTCLCPAEIRNSLPFVSVATGRYCMGRASAYSRSQLMGISIMYEVAVRAKNEISSMWARFHKTWQSSMECSAKRQVMKAGCAIRPVRQSAVARLHSRTLDRIRREGVLATAMTMARFAAKAQTENGALTMVIATSLIKTAVSLLLGILTQKGIPEQRRVSFILCLKGNKSERSIIGCFIQRKTTYTIGICGQYRISVGLWKIAQTQPLKQINWIVQGNWLLRADSISPWSDGSHDPCFHAYATQSAVIFSRVVRLK